MLIETLEQLGERRSRWYRADADRVRAFADVTQDWQPIHLDAAFAAGTPYGVPIVHGFLTLSLLPVMSQDIMPALQGVKARVNYGFDRVRFLAPVPVGTAVRGVFLLSDLEEREQRLILHWDVSIEIEDSPKPALAAEWITMLDLDAAAQADA